MCSRYVIDANVKEACELHEQIRQVKKAKKAKYGEINAGDIAPVLMQGEARVMCVPMIWGFLNWDKKSWTSTCGRKRFRSKKASTSCLRRTASQSLPMDITNGRQRSLRAIRINTGFMKRVRIRSTLPGCTERSITGDGPSGSALLY